MLDVDVIEDPGAAAAILDPVRGAILAALAEPGSATTVARRLDLPRQKVNYHVRALEQHDLVKLVEHIIDHHTRHIEVESTWKEAP